MTTEVAVADFVLARVTELTILDAREKDHSGAEVGISIRVTRRSSLCCPPAWAIEKDGGSVWDKGLKAFVWEPRPSGRSDEFLEACRYSDLSSAVAAAQDIAAEFRQLGYRGFYEAQSLRLRNDKD